MTDTDTDGTNPGLTRALETAKQHIPIQREVCKPEFWVGFTVVLHNDRYSVYSADAWEEPTQAPLLPWSPPKGIKIAHVAADATVTAIAPAKSNR